MDDLLGLTPEDAALLVKQQAIDAHLIASGGEGYTDALTKDEEARYTSLWGRIVAHAALVSPPLNGDSVWGGNVSFNRTRIDNGTTHNEVRTIVRAKTKAEAIRLLNAAGCRVNASHFSGWWGKTGNRQELAQATERGVWARAKEGWVKVWSK